jgi:hypothetical protein
MGRMQRLTMLQKILRLMVVMMKMQMLVTWAMLMLMRVLMLCLLLLLLLQFISCSHSGSLLLDTLILILLIFNSP